jgi:hypothetical protein
VIAIKQGIAIAFSLTEGLLNWGNANEVFHPKHLETQNSPNSPDQRGAAVDA